MVSSFDFIFGITSVDDKMITGRVYISIYYSFVGPNNLNGFVE